MSVSSLDVVAQAREWLGVPFRHQGRTRYGVDCVGLVLCVYKELGIAIPDNPVYQREVRDTTLYTQGSHNFYQVSDEQAGDILQFDVRGFPTPHIAISAGKTMIHAFYKHGKVIEQTPWTRGPITLRGIWRFNG